MEQQQTYVIGKRFDVYGDGSWEHPFELGGGVHFAHFAHLAIGLNRTQAYFKFSGHKALAMKDSKGWHVFPRDKGFPYEVETIEGYLNQGFCYESFICFPKPVDDPII